jgi:hypothetical protein
MWAAQACTIEYPITKDVFAKFGKISSCCIYQSLQSTKTQNTKHKTQNTKHKTQNKNTKHKTQNTKHRAATTLPAVALRSLYST